MVPRVITNGIRAMPELSRVCGWCSIPPECKGTGASGRAR